MITEKDLQEAIAECEGQRNPNANTCMKLAAFYTIRNELFGSPPAQQSETYGYEDGFSHDSELRIQNKIMYDSGSDFSNAIQGMEVSDLLPVMDELMESVKVIMPRLHDSVIMKLRNT